MAANLFEKTGLQGWAPRTLTCRLISTASSHKKAVILHVASSYTDITALPTLVFFCLENRVHCRMRAPKHSDAHMSKKEKLNKNLFLKITRTHTHKGFISCQQWPIYNSRFAWIWQHYFLNPSQLLLEIKPSGDAEKTWWCSLHTCQAICAAAVPSRPQEEHRCYFSDS